MERLSASELRTRVLCLGNDLLTDDAFGPAVAEELRRRFGPAIDVVCSASAGLHLFDEVLGAEDLLVIDTVMTGDVPAGTIRQFREYQVRPSCGGSPHAFGLFEVLEKARELSLAVPQTVTIIAVEAADCTTVGGAMNAAVQGAIEPVARMVGDLCRV